MRKFLLIVAVALFSIPLFSGNEKALASEIESTSVTESFVDKLQIDSFKQHVLEKLKNDYPKAQFVDITTEEFKQIQKNKRKLVNPNLVSLLPHLH